MVGTNAIRSIVTAMITEIVGLSKINQGIIHKENLLIYTYIPFAIVEAVIVIGLLVY